MKEMLRPILVQVFEKDDGRTIDVYLGQLIEITLPENATTGYQWAIDTYPTDLLDVISTQSVYNSNTIGAGGNALISFRVRKQGCGEIVLKHWRSWEGASSVTKRFYLSLNVHCRQLNSP